MNMMVSTPLISRKSMTFKYLAKQSSDAANDKNE